MPSIQKLIFEDYKRRMMAPNTTYESTVRAVARKFNRPRKYVRQSISNLSPTGHIEAVQYKIQSSHTKGMRKIVVQIRGQEVTWITSASDEEIQEKIEKLRHRITINA